MNILVQQRNNPRVSSYILFALILRDLRLLARASCYKATCILLRFHVYPATQSGHISKLAYHLNSLPVLPVTRPCKKRPVVGTGQLWKSGESTALPAPLAERRSPRLMLQMRIIRKTAARIRSRPSQGFYG